MARKPNTQAKPDPKAKGKAAAPKPAEPEQRDNRYLRAARIIIEAGDGVDLAELAVRATMSEATAGHCRKAFRGVTQALREAKLLPERKAPDKAPAAPQAPDSAEAAPEPEPVAA